MSRFDQDREELIRLILSICDYARLGYNISTYNKGKDIIYRQDAIDAAKAHWYKPDIAGAIEQLPSAFPLCTEEIAQFTGEIIEIFEDFLERKQIVIANDEKDDAIADGEDPACIGNIYGTDYGELQSDIEETLLRWRLIKEEK